MRHVDTQQSLQDGVDLAELPPMGPDGAPILEPARELPPDPPRLCAAGPCRNYHTFQIQLDAQNPKDVGKHGRVFHTERHHYCYPTVGVETNLGSLPVLSCNRWVPLRSLFRTKRSIKRAFERELDVWRDAHEPSVVSGEIEADDIDVVVVAIKHDLTLPVSRFEHTIVARPGDSIRSLVFRSFENCDLDAFTVTVTDDAEDPGAYDNLDATLEQLGIGAGARVVVTLTPNPEIKENV